MLSITTDYAASWGDPSPYLRRIADAGFSHVHWCHHWKSDFLYSRHEIEQIGNWLCEYGLKLLDLHGSSGQEKQWWSPREYERLAGVELVQNRIDMTARLGGDAVVMHVEPQGLDPLRRSLDELYPFARERGIRIAIENGDFVANGQLLREYPPDFLGLCYDSGHGNIGNSAGLDHLEVLKDRLIVVHLHDNDGTGDLHNLLFTGTVDWSRLARIVARSSYGKCVSMEPSMNNAGIKEEAEFLARAFEGGTRLAQMIEQERKGT